MLKEKYSRDMEGVQPSAELENNILAAIGREKAKRPRRRIKMLWAAPVALLTCCAIVLGLFLGFGGGQKTPGISAPPRATRKFWPRSGNSQTATPRVTTMPCPMGKRPPDYGQPGSAATRKAATTRAPTCS